MRYTPAMQGDQHLQRFVGADALFLDTTYCGKKHTFPAQEEGTAYIASKVCELLGCVQAGGSDQTTADEVAGEAGGGSSRGADEAAGEASDTTAWTPGVKPSRVVLISTYGIGKERVLRAVSEAAGVKLAVTEKKMQVLRALELPGVPVVQGACLAGCSGLPLFWWGDGYKAEGRGAVP